MLRIKPRAAPLAALIWLLALPAAGQSVAPTAEETDKRRQLQRTERELTAQRDRQRLLERDAAALTREIEEIRQQMVIAGRSARENESALSALEDTLGGLEQEAKGRQAALAEKRRAVAQLAAALQRLALLPPDAMALLPQDPKDTVRSAMIMSGAVPALEARIAALRDEMTDLARTRQKITQQKTQIEKATGNLTQQRQALDELLKRKQALEQKTVEDAAKNASRVARLASTAKDLKDLVEKLEADRKAEEARLREEESKRQHELERQRAQAEAARGPTQEASIAQGAARTLPAAGRILINWGQPETGGPARGITIETRPEATVVASGRGKVQFAGPFRGYGLILILEHGDGYHSLVAGLSRIDVEVGRSVAPGEPVGVMGRPSDRNPLLYFELRNNGQPTNPQPWLARRSN